MDVSRAMFVASVVVAVALAGCVGSEPADTGPSQAPGNETDDDVTEDGNATSPDPANETAPDNATGPEPVNRTWSADAVVGLPLLGAPKEEVLQRSYANRDTVNGTHVVFFDLAVDEGYATLNGSLTAPQTDPEGVWPDYDLYALDPDGQIAASSASLGTDEQVTVDEPAAGTWTFAAWYSIGETVEGAVTEAFTLQAAAEPAG